MKKTLIVKNFSGSFNDEYIGHEIINSFDFDYNKTDYYLFYVPAYGSIFSEKEFFNHPDYKEGFEKIVVFEETGITNVFKLKAVALNPKPIDETEYSNYLKQAKYNGKALKNIQFGSIDDDDPLKKAAKIYHFTYLVKKGNYYNFEDDNLLIWHSSTKVRNELKSKSIKEAKKLYGKKPIEIDDTAIGEKNYCYNVGDEFEDWYKKKVKRLLTRSDAWILPKVGTKLANVTSIYNDDNLIKNLNRTSDENLYSNFIKTILKQNPTLKDDFFSYLVEKLHHIKGYKATSVSITTQKQSLIKVKRAVNSYLKNKGNKAKEKRLDAMINQCPSVIQNVVNKARTSSIPLPNGYIDLYLEDDNYRFVIENKIYSGIGKRKDGQDETTQIEVYRTYLEDLNRIGTVKDFSIAILCPESEKNVFANCGGDVVLTYKDLYEFFANKKALISKNYDDFINALAFHALTKEQIITARFLRTLKA